MKKAATILAMAGAMMGMEGLSQAPPHSARNKYPSVGGSTNHGKYTRSEYKRRKAAKRSENQARNWHRTINRS